LESVPQRYDTSDQSLIGQKGRIFFGRAFVLNSTANRPRALVFDVNVLR
jgi:hypothetical protein